MGWVSAASAHYVDVEAADWQLPEEAFPLRSAPPAHKHAPPTPPPHASHILPPAHHAGIIDTYINRFIDDTFILLH